MKRKLSPVLALITGLLALSLPACARTHAEDHEPSGHEEQNKIIVTTPVVKNVVITQPYVCQIHARRHIEVKALEEGYLEEIKVKEGQMVKKDQIMFTILPPLYIARLEAEKAEAQFAEVELTNTEMLHAKGVVSEQEVKLYKAKLAKVKAKVKQAETEFMFTEVKAPFDGIMDRQYMQQGSLVKKEEVLTRLSDTAVMWVYFNVPETDYLEYKALQGETKDNSQLTLVDTEIQLYLANGNKFKYSPGNTVTVEGKFNNENGNIAFRADFPNPEQLLMHGQTGTVKILHNKRNAIIIPQRAKFEILDQLYVWVVGEDNIVHQRPIIVEHELEDIYVIKDGLSLKDKIILEGVQQVHEGQKIEYEFKKPGEAVSNQKFHAE